MLSKMSIVSYSMYSATTAGVVLIQEQTADTFYAEELDEINSRLTFATNLGQSGNPRFEACTLRVSQKHKIWHGQIYFKDGAG